ncbi:MAG: type II toxin-antitoxin system PemK/MazF family toxin [Leptospirales bacterium]
MTRGEIWWAYLRKPVGSEPGFKRPVLIIQSDLFNKSNINTIICAAITSNMGLANVGKNIVLKNNESGLPKDSVINISQIVTLDRQYLDECIGSVARKTLNKVDDGLRVVLF